jgi:AcrR family transcriptional regulator
MPATRRSAAALGIAPTEFATGPRGGPFPPRVQVSEIQRTRLLKAAVATVEELGYAGATVAHITGRARVSRRTFYDLFRNREDCLLAALEDTVECMSAELAAASLEHLAWRERMRTGLWTILCALDREPALARVCVVQSACGSRRVLMYREDVLARLATVVDAGRSAGRPGSECPSSTAQALVGAAVSMLYTRLLRGEGELLSDLFGELMGLFVLPYMGPAAARRERTRPAPPSPPAAQVGAAVLCPVGERQLPSIPMRLTYRTARVLEEVAAQPGVSNRIVAESVGIADQGQMSKLLARLERLGLLVNTGGGHVKGEANAWGLTATGRELAEAIRASGRYQQ